ncbi:MAG: FHA domain-containing protein, partial [Polyangiaceae bacterium]
MKKPARGKTGGVTELLTQRGATGEPGPRFSLVAYHRDGAKVLALELGKPVVLGRTPPADLVVPDASLSRQHARFGILGDGVVVEDLGSTNGTWLGGKSIESENIRPGDVVMLGSVRVLVQALGGRPRLGLEGHDAFLGLLESEMKRSRHFGRPMSLLMMRSADRDVALHEWAQAVCQALRDVDTIASYGGESIEALLPEANEAQARELAKKVERAVTSTTIRFGVAAFPGAGT